MTTKDVYSSHEEKMQKALDALRRELATLRAGRATPALLDKVTVDYYGTPTPINQVANIAVPEPRMITIQPWEKTMVAQIEKALLKSDLGLTPNSDGLVIRLLIPQLTQQRRTELVKMVHKKAEESRVAVRNLRRDANEATKKLEKEKTISEDETKKAQDDIQKLTDKYIKEIDRIMAGKEKEIMEVQTVDTVGQPLSEIRQQLDKLNSRYTITCSRPITRMFSVDDNCLYVIRQHIDADGIYHLVAAGKMGKEVL